MGTRLRDHSSGGMSRPAKPAIVRYYVDADVLGLAKILVQIRSDVTYPGDPGGPVKEAGSGPPAPSVTPAQKTRSGFRRQAAGDGSSSHVTGISRTIEPRSMPCA
jgi:hypothetical protein